MQGGLDWVDMYGVDRLEAHGREAGRLVFVTRFYILSITFVSVEHTAFALKSFVASFGSPCRG